MRNRAAVNKLIGERIAETQAANLLSRLAEHFVPAGAVNSMDAVFQQPSAQSMTVECTLAGGSQITGIRQAAFKLDGKRGRTPERPPSYGEHTRQVLGQMLGLQTPELDELEQQGVIACRSRS